MCNHKWNEKIQSEYFDRDKKCMTEIRIRTCIFCGKKRKEIVLVKDPPKRKLPKFIRHDLSDN